MTQVKLFRRHNFTTWEGAKVLGAGQGQIVSEFLWATYERLEVGWCFVFSSLRLIASCFPTLRELIKERFRVAHLKARVVRVCCLQVFRGNSSSHIVHILSRLHVALSGVIILFIRFKFGSRFRRVGWRHTSLLVVGVLVGRSRQLGSLEVFLLYLVDVVIELLPWAERDSLLHKIAKGIIEEGLLILSDLFWVTVW